MKQQPSNSSEPLPNSQESEQQWLASSQFPKTQVASPSQPQKWRFVHHGPEDAQEMAFDEYAIAMHEEGGLEAHDDAVENQGQTSGSLLEDEMWTSTSISQQEHARSVDTIEPLDGAYNGDAFTDKSSPLSGQPLPSEQSRREQVAMVADINTMPPTNKHRSSVSRSSGQRESEVARIPADEWHKYF